ncbi:Nucleoporin p58/p45 [Gonapodya sp. JEL0774]|nr:Nucleoporin p58/p45 [Gonapodya sp. JEL0774]
MLEVADIIRKNEEMYAEIVGAKVGSELDTLAQERKELAKKLSSLKTFLESDLGAIETIKDRNAREYRSAEQAGRFVDRLQGDPTRAGVGAGLTVGDFTMEFFAELVKSFEERIRYYRQSVEDLEKNVSSMTRTSQLDPRLWIQVTLQDTIRAQYESFLYLASRVAGVHDEIRRAAEQYKLWRARRMRVDIRGPGGFGPDVSVDDLRAFARQSALVQHQGASQQQPGGAGLFGASTAPSGGGLFGTSASQAGSVGLFGGFGGVGQTGAGTKKKRT